MFVSVRGGNVGRGLQSKIQESSLSIDEARGTELQDLQDLQDSNLAILLLVSQRYQWVDFRSAPRGNVTREESRDG